MLVQKISFDCLVNIDLIQDYQSTVYTTFSFRLSNNLSITCTYGDNKSNRHHRMAEDGVRANILLHLFPVIQDFPFTLSLYSECAKIVSEAKFLNM